MSALDNYIINHGNHCVLLRVRNFTCLRTINASSRKILIELMRKRHFVFARNHSGDEIFFMLVKSKTKIFRNYVVAESS